MSNVLPTSYQNFIAMSRYARWNEEEGRRETRVETVCRYFDYMESVLEKKHSYKLSKELRRELEQAVIGLEIMPSMRAVMTAGLALDRCNVGAYNCSYLPVDNPRSFDEAMYVLMNGTGVGFSIERDHVEKLPIVSETFHRSNTMIVVDDSLSLIHI